jgi:polyphosphate kinase 2
MAKKGKKKNKDKKDKSTRLKGSVPRSHEGNVPSSGSAAANEAEKLTTKMYEKELAKLQVELVRLQEWVKDKKLKVVVVFEGRDTAGKGGMIKRITERVSPRVFRVVALPVPTEREKSQMYFQRYIPHFPAGGEVVLFDRSWYNRAGVEHVMGFCTQDEYEEFMRTCPRFEESMVRSGIILLKYFLDVGQEEQARRFQARIQDPAKHWKLSPMDVESVSRWWDYTKAYDKMVAASDTPYAPWYVVRADDKKKARLNCIAHLLSKIAYKKVPFEPPSMPKLKKRPDGVPEAPMFKNLVPEIY